MFELDPAVPVILVAGGSQGARRLNDFPASIKVIESVEPVWEEFEGWTEPLSEARSIEELPANARRYMHRLEELIETEIILASIGPDRDQTIIIRDPFEQRQ